MGNKNSSFHMSNEFNGYGQKTYLTATQYNTYPALSQENVRLTPDFGSLLSKALGSQLVMINAVSGNPMLLKALGGLTSANQIVIGKDKATGKYLFSYAVSGSNEFTNNSYLLAASNKSDQPVFEIVPYGWVQFGAGWKWGEETGNYKKEGWLQDNKKWYYFGGEWMLVGWQLIDYQRETDKEKKKYYFYFRPDINEKTRRQTRGDMVTGWFEIHCEGSLQWFYFHGDGTMAAQEWIHYEEDWYYMRSNGPMLKSSWKSGENGEWYYLKSDGKMAANEDIVVDGVTYSTNENGVCTEKDGNNNLNNQLTVPIVTKLLPTSYQCGQQQQITLLVLHDTGNVGGDKAINNYNYFNTDPSALASKVSAHAFLDDTQLLITVPENQQANHTRGSYNGRSFNKESYGLELCNLLSQSKVDEQFNNAAIYYASLCNNYGINPSTQIKSHGECTTLGKVSGGHMDPHVYLQKWGHNMDEFRALVAQYM